MTEIEAIVLTAFISFIVGVVACEIFHVWSDIRK